MPYNMYYDYKKEMDTTNWCPTSSRLNLRGQGTVSVKPDIAYITIGVETRGRDLKQVQEENALKSNAIINGLINMGIQERDIQTNSYIISPEYDFIEGKQVFRGYRVINTLKVTVRNIAMAGAVIDSAVENGANVASNIEFGISEPTKYYNHALNIAIEDALRKAQEIGRRFNYHINSNPIKITEESYGISPAAESKTFQAASEATPIKGGTIEINAAITAVFCYR